MSEKNKGTALYTLITVFFFWGFVAASNGIFIPFCKTHFQLSQFESQLIDFTFYGGYFIGSLLLYFVSQITRIDIINRIGFKKGIIIGLYITSLGSLLMVPAINSGSFTFILISLFIIALGFSLQQTAANPFAVALGTPETGANRLNLAGGVNNFGSLLGPIIVSVVLFGTTINSSSIAVDISSMNNLYYILAVLFIGVALFFGVSNLPSGKSNEPFDLSNKASIPLLVLLLAFFMILIVGPLSQLTGLSTAFFVYSALALIILTLLVTGQLANKNTNGWGAMKFPQLIFGMIAIFTYVGVEVSIQSNLGALLATPEFGSYQDAQIAPFISLYWGSLMIGRWTGAISAFNINQILKRILTVIVPFLAFAVILILNKLSGTDISSLIGYSACIIVLIVGFYFSQESPIKTLAIFSILGVLAMLLGLMTSGMISTFAFISGGLCCSIMWPCIFLLSITGLGKYTSQGSSFLIMMILGGAIIPPVQGILADNSGIHFSYIIPVICFAYLLFFTWKVSKTLKKQGINLENIKSEGGH